MYNSNIGRCGVYLHPTMRDQDLKANSSYLQAQQRALASAVARNHSRLQAC
jgi:hypothetical protein